MSLVQNLKFQNNCFIGENGGGGLQFKKLKMRNPIFLCDSPQLRKSSNFFKYTGLPTTDNTSETTVQHLNVVLHLF